MRSREAALMALVELAIAMERVGQPGALNVEGLGDAAGREQVHLANLRWFARRVYAEAVSALNHEPPARPRPTRKPPEDAPKPLTRLPAAAPVQVPPEFYRRRDVAPRLPAATFWAQLRASEG